MRKFPLIAIFALFLCVISVNAAIDIKNTSVTLKGTVGETKSSSFLVENTGLENLDINFTIPTLIYGTNQLTLNSFKNITNLPGSSVYIANFSVTIPAQKIAGFYTGILTAKSGSISDIVNINVNVTPTYSVITNPASEMNLGSAGLNSTPSKTFNITNTGNADITNAFFGFSKNGFDLQADKKNFTLAVGATETIKFNITIPADYSTGNVTLGTVKLISTELGLDMPLFSVKAEVSGGLIIEDLDVFLTTRIKRRPDGILTSETGNDLDVHDTKRLNFDDKEVGPGSELRFNFNIENTFTDEDDVDINDVTVKVTILEIDDGSDIEQESEEFDLKAEQSRDLDVIVNIPLSVNEGTYDVLIEVSGDDDSGNEHTAQMSLKLDIDKETRDIIVSEVSLFPETIKCSGSTVLTATIKNLGKDIENDARLEITNTDLKVNYARGNLELEETPFDGDDEFTQKLTINVDSSTKAGTYTITVKSYLQEGILWDTKTINLVVEACSQVPEEEKPKVEETPEVVEEIEETEPVGTGVEEIEETTEGEEVPVLEPITTTEIPLTKRPGFWFVLIAFNIIIIFVIALLVVKFALKK